MGNTKIRNLTDAIKLNTPIIGKTLSEETAGMPPEDKVRLQSNAARMYNIMNNYSPLAAVIAYDTFKYLS